MNDPLNQKETESHTPNPAMAMPIELLPGVPRGTAIKYANRARMIGIGGIGLGVVAVLLPGVFTIGLELFLGSFLLIAGLLQVGHALGSWRSQGGWFPLVTGSLSSIAGFLFLANPFEGAAALTLLLATLFFVNGALRIGFGIKYRQFPGTGWGLFHGFLGILIAILVWSAWPSSSIWFIGLLLGIDLLFMGVFLTVIGNAWRKALKDTAAPVDNYTHLRTSTA